MVKVWQNCIRARCLPYLSLGLILFVHCACKVPPASNPSPPPPGGVQISVTGYPESFFNARICHYAICQFGGEQNNPAERIAEGTFSLNGGSGVSEEENLESGQYDLYIAVDVDGNGCIFDIEYPPDGDLHGFDLNVTVADIINPRFFTLKAVTGEASWSWSGINPEIGDLHIILCTHESNPDGIEPKQEVKYSGIATVTSAAFTLDASDPDLSDGPYYLLGVLTLPGKSWLFSPEKWRWYKNANGRAGTDPPPVNLDSLQDSYLLVLNKS
jgi:hypothetical protein